MTNLPDYPWDSMVPYRNLAAQHPEGLIDLSIGSPVDPTPEFIRDALAQASEAHSYPQTIGTVQLRETIVNWFVRRRGVLSLDTSSVLPSIGSKEVVALLPLMLGLTEFDTVVHPRVAYPTYAIGAAMAGATAVASDDPSEWPDSTRLVWVNSPGNPDGRVLEVPLLARIVDRARELGAIVVGDECYAELGWLPQWSTSATPSILDRRVTGGSNTGVLAIYSLSKQSNLAGYRAAFIAGDSSLVDRLSTVRKHAGLMVPAPLQQAMIAALDDDKHVIVQKERYRARRELLIPALRSAGFRIDASEAGLYLWATEGRDGWESLSRLADLGIVGGPGHFYGDFYPNHIRLSITATDTDIALAARRLSQ